MRQTSINSFIEFKSGLEIQAITPDFLMDFEKEKKEKGYSRAAISSHIRHLRRMINHILFIEKTLPKEFKSPFGKGIYTIKNY